MVFGVRRLILGGVAAAWGAGGAMAQAPAPSMQPFMVQPGARIAAPSVTPPPAVPGHRPLTSSNATPGGVVRLVNTQPAASDAGRPSGPIMPPGQVTPIDNTVQPLSPNFVGLAPMPTERTFQNPPGHSFAPRTLERQPPDRERPNAATPPK
jgi:hypothetical protein